MDKNTETPLIKQRGLLLATLLLVLAGLLLSSHTLLAAQTADDEPVPTRAPELEEALRAATQITATDEFERYKQAQTIPEDVGAALFPADLSGSEKRVDRAEAEAGETVRYTIYLSNTQGSADNLELTDTLPAGTTYVPSSLETSEHNAIIVGAGEASGVITWTGSLGPDGWASITFQATLDESLAAGEQITNTASVTGAGDPLELSATTEIVTRTWSPYTYMPAIFTSIDEPSISASRPNSGNEWTISWGAVPDASAYVVEESHYPDFRNATSYTTSSTSYGFDPTPSTRNVYYYRVRTRIPDGRLSGWSNVVEVVGAYRDDFTNRDTGWSVRRTTYIDEVQSWYEIRGGDDWLILRVEDSWDWGIAAPHARTPLPPYRINVRMKAVNLGNLVSQGFVFGGDWPGAICPDPSTVAGWYEHELCFNQFYVVNTIWFNELKLLFERVNRLVWCPSCDGSPMKRLGEQREVSEIPNVDADGWNNWRVDVRDGEIKLYANGKHFFTYGDTRYINNRYFGVFASTDEYSNSTARFEYFEVVPLD